ncbi:MAG: hypothetical protein ABSH10_06690 [Phycisphaerae bacterium]|jgi:hypothetical protein
MKKFISALLIVLLSGAAAQAAAFVAYNDFGGTASGYDGNYVTWYGANQKGALYDYNTATSTGVTMKVGVAMDPSGGTLVAGTSAYNYFNGKVNPDGYIYNTSSHPLTLTFSGLDSNETYEVALFGDAGHAGWTNSNVYTIQKAVSFDNFSDGTLSGTDPNHEATSTMSAGDNDANGYIADYKNIVPRADGTFSIRLTATGGNNYWILNALMLSTMADGNGADETPTSAVIGDAPEPLSLALMMGLGIPLIFRRRRTV